MRWMSLLPVIGCARHGVPDSGVPTVTATPTPTGLAPVEVIHLTTADGVDLVADAYQGSAMEVGFVLLHMIPPTWDRTSWPVSFVDSLRGQGWWVVVLDRRGAGDSGGVAEEAYEGPNGKLDVEAASDWLAAQGVARLAVIGASNGTTSLLDYAAWAPGAGKSPVAAAGFMTGGTYTENNTAMADFPAIPAVFTYSTEERDWSVTQQGLDPGGWSFLEYPAGAHGTLMFDAQPQVAGDLVSFFAAKIGY